MTKRTALITGASRGIGKACAQLLAAGGYRVALAARSLENLEAVAAPLRDVGGEAYSVVIDFANRDSIVEGCKKTAQEFGRIDILINNAGVTKDGLVLRMKQADWESVLETNLGGPFYTIQQVLPGMVRERWGRIVNVSSVVGEMGNAGQANYVASKAGLIGLTKALAKEVGSRTITVNAVAPGFIETDMTNVLTSAIKEKMIAETPLKRMGSAQEIAAAIRFLVSEDAAFITGHVLDVNGGIYM